MYCLLQHRQAQLGTQLQKTRQAWRSVRRQSSTHIPPHSSSALSFRTQRDLAFEGVTSRSCSRSRSAIVLLCVNCSNRVLLTIFCFHVVESLSPSLLLFIFFSFSSFSCSSCTSPLSFSGSQSCNCACCCFCS